MCELVKNVAKSRFSNLKLISQSENSISSGDLYAQEPQRWCPKQSRPEVAEELLPSGHPVLNQY